MQVNETKFATVDYYCVHTREYWGDFDVVFRGKVENDSWYQ